MDHPVMYIDLCTPDLSGGCDDIWHSNPDTGALCPSPGKMPRNKGWTDAGSPVRPKGNAGILTGPVSELLVIDVDTYDSATAYEALGLPETYTVLSGRGDPGRHYYFRWPAGLVRVPDRLDGIEIKGPGRQVVAEGSLHASGRRYVALGDSGVAELPEAFVERLRGAARQVERGAPVLDAAEGALVALERILAVLPVANELGDGNLETLCPAHPDHDPSLVLTVSGDRVLVVCRAGCTTSEIMAALDMTPADLFAPPEALTFDVLAELNWVKVEPGGSPVDVEYVQGEDGEWVMVSAATGAPVALLKRRWNGAELAASTLPKVATLPLLGQEGYVGKGLSNLVAAFPKVGKTTLLLAMLREMLDEGRRVLYFTEEPFELWKGRLDGEPDSWAGLDLVDGMGLPVGLLLDVLREDEADVVVVDTLRSIIGWDDENDNAKIAGAVTPWITACREGGKTLIGLHHATKAGGAHGKGIAGGHALFGAFDQALEIDRVTGSETHRRIRAMGRIGYQPDLVYEMLPSGTLQKAGALPAGVQAEMDGKLIITYVTTTGELCSPDKMAPLVGIPVLRSRAAFDHLETAGWIRRSTGKAAEWLGDPVTGDGPALDPRHSAAL